ncbi:unnamed protein product [Boreogadus saida]
MSADLCRTGKVTKQAFILQAQLAVSRTHHPVKHTAQPAALRVNTPAVRIPTMPCFQVSVVFKEGHSEDTNRWAVRSALSPEEGRPQALP